MELPLLLEVDASHAPNVALILNAPTYLSEERCGEYITQARFAAPTAVRVYTDPTCGASLGIIFVEMDSHDELLQFASQKRYLGPHAIAVELMHLTHGNWDRAGRLPSLPHRFQKQFSRSAEGFGTQGFAIRAIQIGTPNTTTPEGSAALAEIRQRIANSTNKPTS